MLARVLPDALVVEQAAGDAYARPAAVDGFDAILLGHPQPGEIGFTHLEALRRLDGCPPVLLFAAKSDEFLAVDALKAGAASYFPKAQLQARRLADVISAEAKGARSAWAERRLPESLGQPTVAGRRLVEKIYSGELASVYLAVDEKRAERCA